MMNNKRYYYLFIYRIYIE